MIKVGDYLKFKTIVNGMVVEHIDRIEHVEETPNEKVMVYFENMEHGVLFNDIYDSNLVDFKKLYQQQKQRADVHLQDLIEHKEALERTTRAYLTCCNAIAKEKQRADELEKKLNKEVEQSYQMENRWRTEIDRADKYEKRWNELKGEVEERREKYTTSNRTAYHVLLEVEKRMNELEEK